MFERIGRVCRIARMSVDLVAPTNRMEGDG
jgi:hypothetical protein